MTRPSQVVFDLRRKTDAALRLSGGSVRATQGQEMPAPFREQNPFREYFP
jgi:hypothetical protein